MPPDESAGTGYQYHFGHAKQSFQCLTWRVALCTRKPLIGSPGSATRRVPWPPRFGQSRPQLCLEAEHFTGTRCTLPFHSSGQEGEQDSQQTLRQRAPPDMSGRSPRESGTCSCFRLLHDRDHRSIAHLLDLGLLIGLGEGGIDLLPHLNIAGQGGSCWKLNSGEFR